MKSRQTISFILPLLLLVIGSFQPLWATGEMLPDPPAQGMDVEKIPSPDADFLMFYLFHPPNQGKFGVAKVSGEILWQKNTGFRSLLEYVWSKDSKSVILVTDCIQPEADLRAKNKTTRSYFFVMDALQGTIKAEGDLDTDVLDLPKQLPDAVGASHLLTMELDGDQLEVTIDHRGKKVSGKKNIKDLGPK